MPLIHTNDVGITHSLFILALKNDRLIIFYIKLDGVR